MTEVRDWKLAEFVFDALDEPWDAIVEARPTATRVARDLGLSEGYIYQLRMVWARYGDPSKRIAGFTFRDHLNAARIAAPDRRRDFIETTERKRAQAARRDAFLNARLEALKAPLPDFHNEGNSPSLLEVGATWEDGPPIN